MLTQTRNRIVFQLEQLLMRGPIARFAFVLALLLLLAISAGILIRLLVPGFETVGDSIWWAFEHVLVPEYVDGDDGVIKRTVATILIIIGSILFAGAVIAILVQWLDDTTTRLEMGLTPIRLGAHLVVLGWTSRTTNILKEVMASQGRVERFLRQRGAKRLHVALLAEQADAALSQQLRVQLGEQWNRSQIILRNGSPLSLDDLHRVDFRHAGTILLPAADSVASSIDADTRTVKSLMTLGAALAEATAEELPLIVAELQNPHLTETVNALYTGPMEIIAGDEIVARLMVQAVRHPGLSYAYSELLSDLHSNQIYVRNEPTLTGKSIAELTHNFTKGILLGLVRPRNKGFKAMLNPPDDLRLESGDRIVVLAPNYAAAAPPEKINSLVPITDKRVPRRAMPERRRVLILGWNHRAPALLREFAACAGEEFSIDIVSQVPTSSRLKRIAVEMLPEERLEINQMEFDYTVPAYLQSVDPGSYDNLVLLSSERLKSGVESDARTILGYLLLRKLMGEKQPSPPILVELTDADNVSLFEKRRGEIILTPVFVSHMLARVALRRELRAVFEDLFRSGGSEIFFRRIADIDLAETLSRIPDYEFVGGGYTFADLRRVADAQGEIAIGIRRAGRERTANGGIELNPKQDEELNLNEADELIVLATHN